MMLLHDSRRHARARNGELALFADQDRSLWDTEQIMQGRAALDRALALGGRGSYVLQAAVAARHLDEPHDWMHIAVLYGELARLTGSPIVELNRAVAVAEIDGAEVDGAEASLRLVDQLDLDDCRYLHSTTAELLDRLGRARRDDPAHRNPVRSARRRVLRRPRTKVPPGGGQKR